MHELSLFRDLMEKLTAIAEENPGKRITQITVVLGAHSHLSAEHFRYHFDELSGGTAAHGATLDIVEDSDKTAPHAQSVLLKSVEIT